jgi:glycosyltransferase involved in cell wall biosynthesis
MLPAISIITPTFNRAQFLNRMIGSVLNQSFQNWELIILDDGSTDHTSEVVQAFKDSRIIYFYLTHSGAGDKRNMGIDIAKSSYITFLDSDDEAMPNWLEKIHRMIVKRYSLISCGYERIEANNANYFVFPQNMGDINVKINFKSGTLCIYKKILIEIGGFDSSLPSGLNTDLILKVLPYISENNLTFISIDEALIRVYEHSENRIRNDKQAIILGTLALLKKHKSWFKRNPEKYRDYLGVVAVGLAKEGDFKKCRDFFIKAFKLKPSLVRGLKIILTLIPILREKIWKNK